MPECDCGAEIQGKNSMGHYRDRCISCISDGVDKPPHMTTCERDTCTVCDSWLRETGEWVGYLYTATQLYKSRLENENYRLEQFK